MKNLAWGRYLAELFLVAIGVFMGMLVTECNANRKLERDRQSVLAGIENEIRQNKGKLEQLRASRRPFLSAFDSLRPSLSPEILNEPFQARPFDQRLPGWKGIGNSDLENSMFETARYSNVLIGMDIDLLAQLSRVYNHQRQVLEIHKLFLQRFYGFREETTYREVVLMIGQLRQELWGSQYQLIREYGETLERMNQKESTR